MNYTKKPVEIQAVQWDGSNLKELAKFMQTQEDDDTWLRNLNLEYPYDTRQGEHWIFDNGVLMIKTLEGNMMASKGDYIIRGVKGEYYPCKPDIFELTYNKSEVQGEESRFVVLALDALIKEAGAIHDGFEERGEVADCTSPMNLARFINIQNQKNHHNIPPIVSFTIQSDPISEVGVNGVQVLDIIKYTYHLVSQLNKKFPCMHNEKTLEHLEMAVIWQEKRTEDRRKRGVEGKNEA